MGAVTEFLQHRSLLFAIAYRMLGSVQDAEDMVQEAFLRWSQVETADVRSPKDFLCTTITRLCIDHLRSAQVRREQYVGVWLPEPLVTERGADPAEASLMEDSLSTAFLLLLERLSPVERAVFLLRDVFGYEYPKIAEFVGKEVDNCRQLVRRARQRIAEGPKRFEARNAQLEAVTRGFLMACLQGNMDGILGLLSEDVTAYTDGGGKVRALPRPLVGARSVATFLAHVVKNGNPFDAVYVGQINSTPGLVYVDGSTIIGAATLVIEGDRITRLYVVTNPDKLATLSLERLTPWQVPA